MVRQKQTKKKFEPSLRSMPRVQTKKPKRKILFILRILKILSKTPTPPHLVFPSLPFVKNPLCFGGLTSRQERKERKGLAL